MTTTMIYRANAAYSAAWACERAAWDYSGSSYDNFERDYLNDCFEQIILDKESLIWFF